MADEEAEVLDADELLVREYEGDPFGLELARSIRSNESLLNGLQYEYGQKMLDAQQGGGDPPSPFELAQLKKLELQIQNDKVFAEARRLTRRRSRRRREEQA